MSCLARLLPRIVVISGVLLSAQTPASPASRYISVYFPTADLSPSDLEIESPANFHIVSSRSISKPRPLLIVIDPAAFSRAEIRTHMSELAQALIRSSQLWQSGSRVTLGVPVLDGILIDPMTRPAEVPQATDAILSNYISESFLAPENSLGRTLDVIANIVSHADGGAEFDCLILAKDRSFAGAGAEYLESGMERRFLEIAANHGSTFYGYLEGHGVFEKICVSTGGIVSPMVETPGTILGTILEARSRGYVLEISRTAGEKTGGRFPLSVNVRSSKSPSGIRAPQVLWSHPEGATAPDYFTLHEALDCLRRADLAEGDGNLTVGMQWLEAALEKDPWDPDILHRAARAASSLGDLEAAHQYLARALLFNNCPEEAVVLYCDIMRRSGRPGEALAALETARYRSMPETPAIRLEHARLLTSVGRLQEAESLYAAALAAERDQDQIRAEFGRLLWRLGNERGARAQLAAALQHSPGNVTALTGESEIALSGKRLQAALELARRAVEADARNPDAKVQLGLVYSALRDWKSAEQQLLQALNLAPARKEFVYALADLRFQTGRILESSDLLRKLLSDNPSDTETRRRLSDTLVRAGRPTEAAATLESGAAGGGKETPELYLAAARLREKESEYGQALLDYRAMLSLRNSSPSAGPGSSLHQHMLYLSMALDGARELPRLSILRELGGEGALAGLPETLKVPGAPATAQIMSLVVPGGLDLLARALGMSVPEKDDTDAMVRLFTLITDTAGGGKGNSPSRKAIQHLRDFDELVKHLKKTNLIPADSDLVRGQDLVFPLLDDKIALSRTARFLAFFGIKCRLEKRGALQGTVTLELHRNEKTSRRYQLLQLLGVNITRPDQKEIRLTVHDQQVPLLVERDVWARQLPRGKDPNPRSLLERTLASADGMKLYLGLASCSEAVRGLLLRVAATQNLMDVAESLAAFGRYLDVREGQLLLPGATKAWESLLGGPFSEPGRCLLALLRHDNGRAMMLYTAPSAATREEQKYLAGSSERFQQLYESMPSFDPHKLGSFTLSKETQDLRRIVREFSLQNGKLVLGGDPRVSSRLSNLAAESPTAGADPILKRLPSFLGPLIPKMHDFYSKIDTVELLRHLTSQHPQLMTDTNVASIMAEPTDAATLLDLIADLEPTPDLFARYMEYCRKLAGSGVKGWGANRIRSSQSLFHLLSLLRREGAISSGQSNNLLAVALARLESAAEEGEFAMALARFVSTQLLAALRPSAEARAKEDDLLLKSLAGSLPAREFVFDGRRLRFDASALRLQNMKDAIQQQRFTLLSTVLEIYHLLDSVIDDGSQVQEIEASIEGRLAEVRAAQLPTQSIKALRRSVAGVDLEAVRSILKELPSSSKNAEARRRVAQELAAAFHPELGVTLLTYCYAYYGSPAVDTLTFDVNFIRKHDVLDNDLSRHIWRPAHLSSTDDTGSFIAGSVAGLGYVLVDLETASAALGLNEQDASLLPTMLAGMRAIRPALRTERAQEYVALLTRIGREVLTVAALDKGLREWCDGILDRLLLPKRHESVSEGLARLETGVVARILTPSELFFLGQAYLDLTTIRRGEADWEDVRGPAASSTAAGSGVAYPSDPDEQVPAISCPVLDRLKEIVLDAARMDAVAFRNEVAQYGIPLRSRLGLDGFTLASPEPYEHLEQERKKGILFDRICDLKIRLADLHYALGLPAFVAEAEEELALRDILPKSGNIHSWTQVLDRIKRLGIENTRGWIEEALNRGWFVVADEGETGKEGESR